MNDKFFQNYRIGDKREENFDTSQNKNGDQKEEETQFYFFEVISSHLNKMLCLIKTNTSIHIPETTRFELL